MRNSTTQECYPTACPENLLGLCSRYFFKLQEKSLKLQYGKPPQWSLQALRRWKCSSRSVPSKFETSQPRNPVVPCVYLKCYRSMGCFFTLTVNCWFNRREKGYYLIFHGQRLMLRGMPQSSPACALTQKHQIRPEPNVQHFVTERQCT